MGSNEGKQTDIKCKNIIYVSTVIKSSHIKFNWLLIHLERVILL